MYVIHFALQFIFFLHVCVSLFVTTNYSKKPNQTFLEFCYYWCTESVMNQTKKTCIVKLTTGIDKEDKKRLISGLIELIL